MAQDEVKWHEVVAEGHLVSHLPATLKAEGEMPSAFCMPTAPLRPCANSHCPKRAMPGSSFCEQHKRERPRKKYADNRPTPAARGYDHRWRKLAAEFLADHPRCANCNGKAEHAHHIIPRREGGRDVRNNLVALCASCHNAVEPRKTREGGGR